MAKQWYVKQGSKVLGPLSSAALKQMADQESIEPTTKSAWMERAGSWRVG